MSGTSSRTGGDAVAHQRAKDEIAARRRQQEQEHTVVEGKVVLPNGREQ